LPQHHREGRLLPAIVPRLCGVVDRLDDRFGDHPIIVVFISLRHPPFGEPWVEGFSDVELERIAEPA
jgi:hypothetical protein